MSARRRRADALPVPQTEEDARAMLAEMGELDAKARHLKENLVAAIAHMSQINKESIDALEAEATDKFLALKAYFEAHINELPKGRKSFKWPEGELGARMAQPAVKHTGKAEDVIERIKAAGGLEGLLTIKYSLDKPAIRKAVEEDEELAKKIGVRIEQPEEVFARPASAKEERTAKVKPQKVKEAGK